MSRYVTTGTVQVLRGLPPDFNTGPPEYQARWLAAATEQALPDLVYQAAMEGRRPVWGTLRVRTLSRADDLSGGTSTTPRHYQATVGTEPQEGNP